MTNPERIRDVPQALVLKPSLVRTDDPISIAIGKLIENPESRMVYVVEGGDRLVGVVSFRSLLRVAKARMGVKGSGMFSTLSLMRRLMAETVGDVMRPAISVTMDTTLGEAILKMEETQQNDLPIVDASGAIVGELNGMQVMELCLKVFKATEAELASRRGAGIETGASEHHAE